MTSQALEGYRRVTFAVISEDGRQLPAVVSCLMCSECQALILQNNFDDYVEAHRLWHEKLNRHIDGVETELFLNTNGEWEEREKL